MTPTIRKSQIVAALAIISLASPICSHAQLPKSQQTSVVLLKSPGHCTGTGFFVSGTIIRTAAHCVQTAEMEVHIKGRRYYATVLKRDDSIDFCELRILGYSCPKPLKTSAPAIGETVYTYGYPDSGVLEGSWGTVGIKYGFYYVDGIANEGMSGGPVVNSRGVVVGVITNQSFCGGALFRRVTK